MTQTGCCSCSVAAVAGALAAAAGALAAATVSAQARGDPIEILLVSAAACFSFPIERLLAILSKAFSLVRKPSLSLAPRHALAGAARVVLGCLERRSML
jgi:hypothetical protein